MTAAAHPPLQATLRWLADHAGFPGRRLPLEAETLLLLAAAARQEEADIRPATNMLRIDPVNRAAQRSHALRRSQVHFKCDNSAKV